MERRTDRQHQGALRALGLGEHDGALHGGLVARHHNLAGRVVVRGGADLAVDGGFAGDFLRLIEIEPEQGSHRTFAHRHGLLHRLTADLEKACRIGQGQRAGSGERGIFPERMAGDIARGVADADLALLLQHGDHRHANRHQRGLGVLGQGEHIVRALEHELGQVLLQRLVDLAEDLARLGEGRGQFLAHADGLGALPRKHVCPAHAHPYFTRHP